MLSEQDRNLRVAGWAALVVCLVMFILYLQPVSDFVGGNTVLWIYDISLPFMALAGAIVAFVVGRSFGSTEILRTIWISLGLGLFLWGIGESLWAYFELSTGDVPDLSIADAAWLLGYIPLFVALILRYRSLHVTPERNTLIAIVAVFLVLVVIIIVFVVNPIVTDTSIAIGERIIYTAYPIADFALTMLALFVLLILMGGQLSRPWTFVAAGFLLLGFADLIYAVASWQGLYDAGAGANLISALTDLPYYFSYVIISYGIYVQARLQKVL